ncbi:MAG: hypothetical protein IPL65_10620 [Lewinellaceae bacterium]|nr:hypothetical protein [Lewinellaceae bacterium]
MTNDKKCVGVWLDVKDAYLVHLATETNEQPKVTHIISNINTGVSKGGSKTSVPWGPQGGVSERIVTEKKHHEEKLYFEEIIKALGADADALFIFGPSQAKYGLKNAIEAIKHFPTEIMEVRAADQMTQNQMVAEVRNFFIEHHVPTVK